jgi:hypothetical protein
MLERVVVVVVTSIAEVLLPMWEAMTTQSHLERISGQSDSNHRIEVAVIVESSIVVLFQKELKTMLLH